MRAVQLAVLVLLPILFTSGCGTTTQRLATEQLLISDAVDQAVAGIDFSYLSGQTVFLDTTYLKSIRGNGFANTEYIVSSIREQLAASGCRIQDERADAQIVVEPRVGALGTDGHEVTYGIPQTGQLTGAAAALSAGVPALPVIPEISFGKSDKHQGIAKIMVFAYDRETKVAVWQSGLKKSESSCTNTWVLGAGPFQKGTIHEGFRFAGRELNGKNKRSSNGRVLAKINPVKNIADQSIAENPDDSAERVAEATSESAPKTR